MTAVAISMLTIPKTYSFIQELYILIIFSLLYCMHVSFCI